MVNTKLKKINFDGLTLYYEVISYSGGEYGGCTYYKTNFYLFNNQTKKVKKYLIFGPLVEVLDNEIIFTIHSNIEDYKFSKQKVRDMITLRLNEYKRKVEIKNGGLI